MAELPGSLAEKVAALEARVITLEADLASWDMLQQTTQDLMEQALEINAGLERRIKRLEGIMELQLRAKRQARQAMAAGKEVGS